MKKTAAILLLAAVLLLTLSGTVSAQTPPTGTCPTGFDGPMSMDMGGGMDDMDHHHAGIQADINGDGLICMKIVAGGAVHVHVDNYVPAP